MRSEASLCAAVLLSYAQTDHRVVLIVVVFQSPTRSLVRNRKIRAVSLRRDNNKRSQPFLALISRLENFGPSVAYTRMHVNVR